MKLDFDFESVQVTEFGVGLETDDAQSFYLVPVDGDVQIALREIATATIVALDKLSVSPAKYEPGGETCSNRARVFTAQ